MIRFDGLPEGVQALTPYLVVKNGDAMIEFYKQAFGAEVLQVHRVPDTPLIMHASFRIGGSNFFLNDEFPQHGSLAPVTTGSTSSSIHIQLSEGIDEMFQQAIAAGAQPIMPPEDMFWGDRFGVLVDPSGHKWSLGMMIANPREVSAEEIKQMMSG
jgi:PhnB protein